MPTAGRSFKLIEFLFSVIYLIILFPFLSCHQFAYIYYSLVLVGPIKSIISILVKRYEYLYYFYQLFMCVINNTKFVLFIINIFLYLLLIYLIAYLFSSNQFLYGVYIAPIYIRFLVLSFSFFGSACIAARF